MIANKILESKLINQYNKMYSIFAQNNALKLNLIEDNIINGIIQDVSGKNVNSTYRKEIVTKYGTLKTGDYITHTYISNGVEQTINYICESQVDKEIGCDKFYLLECPFSVNIFAGNYTDVLTYPIALKNNNANLGITEGAIAITANSSFDIILKYDIHTRSFVTSTNVINGVEHARIMRILIDGMAFNVVGVNHLISKGLLVLSIETTNINPADNIELGVADYTTYYREPIDYGALIDAEMLKYEINANVSKTILANEIITNIVKKLKTGQTANNDITVSVSEVGTNNLLTLDNGIVRLKNQIPFEDDINTTTVTLSFLYGGITKTLTVDITIEKQDIVITDLDIVIAEMPKYETTAFIGKSVIAGENVNSLILKLKDGQIANPDVDTYISYVDTDNLLTLSGRNVTLTDIIPATATDNETVANITFVKGEALRSISVFITIEKQEEQTAPNLEIYCDWEDIEIGGMNDYTINTTEPVTWSLTNTSQALTLVTNGTSNACQVNCAYGTKYIGLQDVLTATVGGFEYYYTVIIVGLI